MKKRLLAIAMTLAMTLSLLPVTAFAAEDGVTMYINSSESYEDDTPPARAEGAVYNSLADAAKAVTTTKDIVIIQDTEWTFTTDFTLEKPAAKFKLQVAENQSLTVDIRGCTVDLNNMALQNYGTLTVTDSTNGGSGTLTSTASPVIENYGSATVSGKVTVATTGSMAVKGTKSTSTFVLENGTLTGKTYGYSGTAVTCQLKQGVINGGVSPSSGSLTIGTAGGDDQSLVINGSLKMSDGVTVLCGDIENLTGTIESNVVFNGILRTDVSSKLPAGKKCTASGPDTKGTYYTIEDMQKGDAAAQVGNNLYASLTTAAKAVKNNETLTLLKDHTGSSTITINAYGVTVDLNGHSITNTSSDEDAVGLKIYPNYGVKPTDGNMTTLIKNSSDTQAAIKASTPLSIGTGNSQNIISASMEGNIALNPAGGQSIELGNARLIYSEDAANTVGGYRATTADGTYIYGTFQAAIDADVNKTAVLLSDVSGSGAIKFSNGETGILDLGGHEYTYTGSGAVIEVNDSNTNLTIKNGTIVSDGEGAYVGLPYQYGPSNMMYPKNVSLTLDGVNLTVKGEGYGAVSNGRCSGINLTLQNGTVLTANNALGIYWPSGDGKVIIDDSQVTAHTGVQVCAGSLEIKGENAAVTATGTPQDKTESDGGILDGAAISIVKRDGYQELGTVSIEAGTFTSKDRGSAIKAYTFNNDNKTAGAWTDANETIAVTGGTFKNSDGTVSDVKQYIPEGTVLVQDPETGAVIKGDGKNAVASVNGVEYTTLAAAINAAKSGDTVKLLKDYDPDENVLTIEGKDNLTLDLGGNTLTLQLDVKNSQLTLQNGNITAPTKTAILSGGAAVYVYGSDDTSAAAGSCVVNVESSAMLSGYYGILVSGPTYGSNVSYGVTVNVRGTVNDPVFISGNLNNASARKGKNATTINILDGAEMNNTVCMNGEAVVNVYDGATVTGDDAIAVKRGQLNITGGTFTATGAKVDPAEANTNGSETTGSAISVTSTYNTDGSEIDINISGGTFTSVNNAAVYLGHSKNDSGVPVGYQGSLDLEISGGDFSGGSGVPSIYVAEKITADTGIGTEEKIAEEFISGGTYTDEVREYLADEIQYEVGHTGGSFTYTKTMEAAQEAAKPGDSITDLKAATGDTVTLTLKYNDDGATEDTVYTVAKDTAVPLPTPTRSGSYTFAGWFDKSGNKVTGTTYTVAEDATLTAQWTYTGSTSSGSTRYTVTVSETAHGAVKSSHTRASRGTTVTLIVTPDEGYELASLAVYDADGNEIELERGNATRYTFTMPRGKVTVEASFAEAEHVCPAGDFTDVSQSAWYHAAVDYVLEQGIMSGVSADRFGPEDTLTRAMAAQMLWALEGKPVVNYLMQYGDVAQGAWYAEAVRWASAQGVMSGYSGETFGPEDNITREQLALILFNYADQAGYDVDGRADLSGYADEAAVSGWAVTALEWAVDAGLISGREGSALAPAATATRAEVAQIFMNFLENVAK